MGSSPFGRRRRRIDSIRQYIRAYAVIGGGLVMSVLFSAYTSAPAQAATGVSQQINFQGRLLNAQGATVPDGYYNIQFKIYQDGDGQSVGNTTGSPAGTLRWTESYLNANSQGVVVRNGFLSVQLGSVTAFGSSVDWNQDTLWLSMNVGSTATGCTPFTSCTPDGEMTPMKRLSSTPYALNAGLLGGLSSAGFIQNTTTPQSADFSITGTGTIGGNFTANGATSLFRPLIDSGTVLQVQNAASQPLLNVDTAGSNIQLLGNNSPVLSTWNTTTAMSVGANTNRARGGSVIANGYLYHIGGIDGTGATIATVQYAKINADGTVGTWASTTALPDTRRQFQPVVANGYLYVIGGRDNSNNTEDTSYYAKLNQDGTVGAWNTTTAPSSGGSARFAAGTVAYDGYMYLIGGFNASVTAQTTVHSIKINTDGSLGSTWTATANMASGRGSITGSVVANGYLYVAGGWDGSSDTDDIYYAKLGAGGTITGSWSSQAGVIPGGDDEDWRMAVMNGYLYLIGADFGSRVSAFPLNANGSTGTPVSLTNFPVHVGEAAVASANGYIYIVGGSSSSDGGGTRRNTIYYASGSRLKVGGNLDLVGYSGENLNEGGAGGSLTAGNTVLVGTLQVQDSASFMRGLRTGGDLTADGDINSATQYRINGSTALTNASLNFSATSAATIQSAASQLLSISGGNATTGNNNGGNLSLSGGTGIGSGSNGLVVISTPTFSTTSNDANCYTGGALVAASCTVSNASVNNSSAIIVGFNQTGRTATLPDPTITTAGRIIYVTAANGSSDFTLNVNGGGTGNSIAMRQNTTATMIWNGSDWTAAGASSSTTLQSAYDNTLQSAGGAELIVSKTSTTNGLTIRESSVNPVDGTLLSVQTASAAVLLSVNSSVTEYSTNGGAEVLGGTATTFPANTWSSVGGGGNIVSRYITAGNFISTGQASVSVAATAANDGVKNRLSTSLTANTNYNVSFAARLTSGTFTDMNVYYSVNGTLNSVDCKLGQAIATSVWTKVNCTFAAPASSITADNAIIIRQASAVSRTFYVENLSVTIAADYNYASDGGASDNVNFATNWSFVNAGTGVGSVTRSTTDGNDASDSASVTLTTGAANAGLRNRLAINPLPSTLYRITAYAKLAAGSFTDFKIRYSPIGSTGSSGNYIDCVDYNTQTLMTTGWTKVTCYISTDATVVTTPYVNFVESTATARTFAVDTFSMTIASDATPNVQIGGGVSGGPTTLFTLDKGASAPIASNNDALLGSMYYDTTLGKLQCYEADGWGACGSSPDNVITIAPEYTNAVLHGTGIGTMNSDLCSDTLNINDGSSGQPTICGSNETFNFYKWTSPQPSAQTYSIYLTYQLPTTFKSFASGQTSIKGRTDNGSSGGSATVQYQIYRNSSSSGLVQCGSTVSVSTGTVASWQPGPATGAADPSTCGFTGGDSVVFKIDVIANNNANAYVGNLNFTFSNK